MKGLIICPESKAELKQYFPEIPKHMIKIANKPLLEYVLEFFSSIGVQQVRVVFQENPNVIENYFQDGLKWGMDIDYPFFSQEDSIFDIVERNCSFLSEGMVVYQGGFFPRFDRNQPPFFQKPKETSLLSLTGHFRSRNNLFYIPSQLIQSQSPIQAIFRAS